MREYTLFHPDTQRLQETAGLIHLRSQAVGPFAIAPVLDFTQSLGELTLADVQQILQRSQEYIGFFG
jgi:hypothetical protein